MTSIYVKEKAAQGTPTADYGQIWAENTVPASFHIEDDVGNPAAVTMGNITGTLVTAAQTNITSLGTLTTLTVDNITVNAATITSDTGAISFGNENLTTTGTLTCAAFTSTGIDDNATSEQLQIGDTRIDCGQPLFILEAAAEETNVAGYGQIWVKNDTPCAIQMADDAGNNVGFFASAFWSLHSKSAAEYTLLEAYNYGTSSVYSPYLGLYRSRGSEGSESQITAGDILGELAFSAYTTAWQYSTSYIRSTSTVNTGNSEPTLTFGSGTDGAMSLFADGHLEVYGPSGDVSEGWSGSTENQVINLKNNGSIFGRVVFADGAGNEGGWDISDSSADGEFLGGISAYGGAHSTDPNMTQVYAKDRLMLQSNGPVQIKNGETVSALSTPTPRTGDIARVTDASSPSIGSTVSGGASAAALVWYNGSNWTVIGV